MLLAIPVPCAFVFAACASPLAGDTQRTSSHADELDRPAWSAPDLERVISVRDGASGARLSFDALLDDLAGADAVSLGETHLDESTHRVELAVYEGLLQRRAGKVVLAMEMFERDVQPALDDYVAGRIDEPAFLARARPWSNYATAYRPLIELARASRRMVVASNFPTPLRRKLGGEGEPSLDQLSAEERALAPRELLPETPEYWRRVDNAIRGHAGMMGAKPADDLFERDDRRILTAAEVFLGVKTRDAVNLEGDTVTRRKRDPAPRLVPRFGSHSG